MTKLFTGLIVTALWAGLALAGSPGADRTMTLGDIMTDTYYEVAGYLNPGVWNDYYDSALVANRINVACRSAAGEFRCVWRDTFYVMLSGKEFYRLPGDFSGMRYAMSIKAGGGLENGMAEADPKSIRKGTSQEGTGIPKFWLTTQDSLQLIPVNNDSDSVHVYYFARANELAEPGDTSNISSDYRTVIYLRAAEMLLRGKLPTLGAIAANRLSDVQALKEAEEARLKERDKSLLEALPK